MGIIVGIAKIIPGVSGAIIAISFGIYDVGLNAITHFFDDVKKNFSFLFSVGIGVLIGIMLFGNIIRYLISNYYLLVMLLFTGLVLGGTINIVKNIKRDKNSYILIILSFSLIILLGASSIDNSYIIKNNYIDYIVYLGAGFMEAIGTVVPGVSSTALLMIMGVYDIFIDVISNIYDINNFSFLSFFGIGLSLGITFVSYVVDYLFKKYRDKTYDFIMGISFGSVILMLVKSLRTDFNVNSLIVGMFLLIFGGFISYSFDKI